MDCRKISCETRSSKLDVCGGNVMLVGICLIIIAWTANLPLWASVTTTVLAGLAAIASLSKDGEDE